MTAIIPRLAVSAGIWRAGRVLLVRRGRPPLRDLWTFPGGHVEPGETLAEAVLREVREETGLAVTLLGDPLVHEIIRRDEAGALVSHHVLLVHAAVATGEAEPVAGSDAAAVRFVPAAGVAALATTPGLARFVAETARRAGAAAQEGEADP